MRPCQRCADLEGEIADLRAELASYVAADEAKLMAADPKVVRELFDHWVGATGRNAKTTKLRDDRRSKIKARLRDGYTVEQLKHAIVGGAKLGHVADNGVRYDDLTTIFQSSSKVELNLARYEQVRRSAARGSTVEEKLRGQST